MASMELLFSCPMALPHALFQGVPWPPRKVDPSTSLKALCKVVTGAEQLPCGSNAGPCVSLPRRVLYEVSNMRLSQPSEHSVWHIGWNQIHTFVVTNNAFSGRVHFILQKHLRKSDWFFIAQCIRESFPKRGTRTFKEGLL